MVFNMVGSYAAIALSIYLLTLVLWGIYMVKKGYFHFHLINFQSKSTNWIGGREFGVLIGIVAIVGYWNAGYLTFLGASKVYSDTGLGYIPFFMADNCGILIAGLCIAEKMRQNNYMTLLDPIQDRYGTFLAILCFLPLALVDFSWMTAVLLHFGNTVYILLEWLNFMAILPCVLLVLMYGVLTGVITVRILNVVLLMASLLGLTIASSSVCRSSKFGESPVKEIYQNIAPDKIGNYLDKLIKEFFLPCISLTLMHIFMCLKNKETIVAVTWISATISTLLISITVTFGVCAKFINLESLHITDDLKSYSETDIQSLVVRFATNDAIIIIYFLAAISAVIVTQDVVMLAISAVFAHNIYGKLICVECSDRELLWITRLSIIWIGIIHIMAAIIMKETYVDLVFEGMCFVTVLPALISSLYLKCMNTYGLLVGFLFAALMQLFTNDNFLNNHPSLRLNYFGDTTLLLSDKKPSLPTKVIIFLLNWLVSFLISTLVRILFDKKLLPRRMDIWKQFSLGSDNKEYSELVNKLRTKIEFKIRPTTKGKKRSKKSAKKIDA